MKYYILLFLLATQLSSAEAHRPSDSVLEVHVQENQLTGYWEIALRDMVLLMNMDMNRDAQLSWGELRQAQPQLEQFLQTQLSFSAGDQACEAVQFERLQLNDRSDGTYAHLDFHADCSDRLQTLVVNYQLLSKTDPSHRGVLVLTAYEETRTAILNPNQSGTVLQLRDTSVWSTAYTYFLEGVRHIWIGFDHILFLIVMLLPCVLIREHGQWRHVRNFYPTLVNVAGVVTAFTLAHSLTLGLAALKLVTLPSHIVEALIAASVILAALNNIVPVITRHRWAVAFLFGLIHGFGFASVLGELGLPQSTKLVALVAFNGGVEAGQMAIVAIVLPLIFAVRKNWLYGVGVRVYGSGLAALVASWWLLQRLGYIPTS